LAKSTVSRLSRDLGRLIIDADLLAREVVEFGEPVYEKIVIPFWTVAHSLVNVVRGIRAGSSGR
jgi:hypothetical protein